MKANEFFFLILWLFLGLLINSFLIEDRLKTHAPLDIRIGRDFDHAMRDVHRGIDEGARGMSMGIGEGKRFLNYGMSAFLSAMDDLRCELESLETDRAAEDSSEQSDLCILRRGAGYED